MASYVCLIQFKDQGIRNIQDTVKRGDAIAEAKKLGMKIVEEYWTIGAYDGVVIIEAPDDETMSAFIPQRWVHSVMSKPKPCARFAGTRWKRFWRRLNSASQSPNFAISGGDNIVGWR